MTHQPCLREPCDADWHVATEDDDVLHQVLVEEQREPDQEDPRWAVAVVAWNARRDANSSWRVQVTTDTVHMAIEDPEEALRLSAAVARAALRASQLNFDDAPVDWGRSTW